MAGTRFWRNDACWGLPGQAVLRVPPSAGTRRARVRHRAASNLPLFAASPVSDLHCRGCLVFCRLLISVFTAFEAVSAEPHARSASKAHGEIQRLIPRRVPGPAS